MAPLVGVVPDAVVPRDGRDASPWCADQLPEDATAMPRCELVVGWSSSSSIAVKILILFVLLLVGGALLLLSHKHMAGDRCITPIPAVVEFLFLGGHLI